MNGIVEVRISADVDQTIEMAQENLQVTRDIAGGESRPVLLDLRKAKPLASHVRRYYANQEVLDQHTAIGLLVEASPFGTALGNFYLRVAQSGSLKKLFCNEEDCLKWLKTFRNR